MTEYSEEVKNAFREDLIRRIEALNPQNFVMDEYIKLLTDVGRYASNLDLMPLLNEKEKDYFQYQDYLIEKKVDDVESAERQKLLQFYDGNAFEGGYPSSKVFAFPPLVALSDKYTQKELPSNDFLQECAQLPSEQVFDTYWHVHNEAYISRLDTLTSQVPSEKKEVLIKSKLVVVLAAMNETELELAYKALKDSYPSQSDFEAEVAVVVYHNFKQEIADLDRQVKQSVHNISILPNVLVVEERVGDEVGITSDVAKAKKVAADVTLRLLGSENKHVLFIDGDLRKINSPGGLKSIQDQLAIEKGVVALTSKYCHDSRLDAVYPALAEYFSIEEFMYEQLMQRSDYSPSLVGGFTLIDSKMFAALGGWPIEKPEDTHFTYNLNGVFRGLGVIKTLFPTVRVELDNGREMESILEGNGAYSRWQGANHQEYMHKSGSKRLAWDKVPPEVMQELPLLMHHLPEKNLTIALNGLYVDKAKQVKSKYPSDITKQFEHLDSRARLLVDYLIKKGVKEVTLTLSSKKVSETGTTIQQSKLLLNSQLMLNTLLENWVIVTFDDVVF